MTSDKEEANVQEFLWELRRLCKDHRLTLARIGLKFCGVGAEFGVWTIEGDGDLKRCVAAVGSPLSPSSWVTPQDLENARTKRTGMVGG